MRVCSGPLARTPAFRLLTAAWLLLVAAGAGAAGGLSSPGIRREFRRAFERPRVDLEPSLPHVETRGDLRSERLSVASEAGVRVPLLIIRPVEGPRRLPVVVCLHGLGGSKEGLRSYLEEFARRGFLCVGLDARYHGERGGDVQAAMGAAFRSGKEHPYLWDTTWDTWRVLDYLETRPDVDARRMGVMGISLGGHTTWMVSADDRVKCAVPCISVCSWRWQLAHEGYKQRVQNLSKAFSLVREAMGEREVTPRVVAEAWKRWLPGVPEKWDCQDLIAAYAPRPILILNGDGDPVAPLAGQKEAYGVIEAAYARVKALDHLAINVAEKSGHTVTAAQRDAMYAWFERWLKPTSR